MSEINIPNIQNINTYKIPNVKNVYIPRWMTTQPNVDHLLPPIVLHVGNPIVDMPGCVEMHKDNKKHKTNIPIDKNLVQDDPKNAMTVCPDGSYPSYSAMNYEPEQLQMTYETKAPPVAPPPEPEVNTPETPSIPPTEGPVDCPGPGQPRIGDLSQNGDEKVIGHELNENKTVCIVLYEDTNAVEKYLPPTNVVTTTASIAAVATASALFAKPLADILLRIVKPAIKQATTKIQKMLGKTPYKPSPSEVQSNLYREKKGLPPLKNAKGKYDFKGLEKAKKKN